MDTETIGKMLSGLLSGGVVGNVASAITEGLKLANNLLEPDPAKRAKARRDYILSLIELVNSIEDENVDVKKTTDLLIALRELMDSY